MHYYLYKITNLINNRIYVGVHKTENLNDGYMGSGKIIRQAIEKYGIENFDKKILEFFDDSDTMYAREKEFINDEFIKIDKVYNLKRGGDGGWDYINKNRLNLTNSSIEKIKIAMRKWHSENDTTGKNNGFFGKKHSEQTKKHLSDCRKDYYNGGGEHPKGMLNKEHSEETKNHLSVTMKMKSSLIGKKGLEHPSGGTKWYNNGTKHLRSDKHPGEGWIEGRIFKKRKRNKWHT